jgi:hypothetical protein
MSFTLFGGVEPERIQTAVVSANFFGMFRGHAALGRDFVPGDELHGAEAVLILSYKYWQRSHKGDPQHRRQSFPHEQSPTHGHRRLATAAAVSERK